jgi:hypothetical protein
MAASARPRVRDHEVTSPRPREGSLKGWGRLTIDGAQEKPASWQLRWSPRPALAVRGCPPDGGKRIGRGSMARLARMSRAREQSRWRSRCTLFMPFASPVGLGRIQRYSGRRDDLATRIAVASAQVAGATSARERGAVHARPGDDDLMGSGPVQELNAAGVACLSEGGAMVPSWRVSGWFRGRRQPIVGTA